MEHPVELRRLNTTGLFWSIFDDSTISAGNRGTILRIDTLNWAQEALVVEYAYDETWAENNVFEDGDLFYLDELSPEEMLAGMLAEIEGTPDPTLPAD